MDIGTAKPSLKERELVRHHLIDVTDIDKVWSLAEFQWAARHSINEIFQRERLPILVGGTGQYVRAITENWSIPRVEPNLQLRESLSDWSIEITPEGLHSRLQSIDPNAAARIEPRNLRRTMRALEVIFTTGTLFSEMQSKDETLYDILTIGLMRERKEVYARIDQRIQHMLENGFVAEVERLLAQGFPADSPPFSAIGYREIIQYLSGEISLEAATVLIKRHTRMFVRRQANWFKLDDPQIIWFNMDTGTLDQLESLIQRWMSS